MSPIQIFKINKFRFRNKICALDYDWTLVKPKSNGTFPKDINDWQWLNPSIPEILEKFYKKGYCLIVFSNQTKIWKIEQIINAINEINLPFMIVVATDVEDRKPSTKMFDLAITKPNWNKKLSFFVGDALGRPNDFSNSDKEFAKNIGMICKSPEEVFPFAHQDIPINTIVPSDNQEIIIMIGYPGSGKSTIANNIFGTNETYVIISGDELKTIPKIIKNSKIALDNGKSIIIDATNPTKEKRAQFITLAKKYGISVRCIHVSTSMEESFARNNQRPSDKIIPKIVYYVYRKKFEPPTNEEGCEVITL